MAEEKRYAVIDGAAEPRLFFILEHFDPPVTCLYDESLQPELLKVAPYLVEVTEKVGLFLAEWGTPWGIFLHSQADMRTLRQHLRKYLQVLLPDQAKPVFFRFYDPRNIWDFLSVLSDWEIHCFLGPIDKIATNYPGIDRRDSFAQSRNKYPENATSRGKLLKISTSQYDILELKQKEKYLQKLDLLLLSEVDKIKYVRHINTENSMSFIIYLYEFLIEEDIYDTRSIEGILKKLISHEYFSIDNFNKDLLSGLANNGKPGWYRANIFIHNINEEV
ncbi:DUF4123 domain-containing protein [Photorhabdus khanii]|uniref:DUF4123 domain-containing protein n=1 Tax=Photorhabdus khanii TaxID=1004150 RepID=UPI001EEFD49A|nr:DUF4123 domain-containing protein [Photorhabdus khanii]